MSRAFAQSGNRLIGQLIVDHDFLPGLARQAGGEGLNLVHGAQHDGIIIVLNVECGDFADERGHFTAIIKITRKLEAGHGAFWRGGGARAINPVAWVAEAPGKSWEKRYSGGKIFRYRNNGRGWERNAATRTAMPIRSGRNGLEMARALASAFSGMPSNDSAPRPSPASG